MWLAYHFRCAWMWISMNSAYVKQYSICCQWTETSGPPNQTREQEKPLDWNADWQKCSFSSQVHREGWTKRLSSWLHHWNTSWDNRCVYVATETGQGWQKVLIFTYLINYTIACSHWLSSLKHVGIKLERDQSTGGLWLNTRWTTIQQWLAPSSRGKSTLTFSN